MNMKEKQAAWLKQRKAEEAEAIKKFKQNCYAQKNKPKPIRR